MNLPPYIINQVRKKAFKAAELPSAVHTVCEEARCPNRGECFSQKTVTFLLLGKTCTRNCRFCGVEQGHAGLTPADEIERILATIHHLQLRYIVLTSVTRDDLSDGGASIFAEAIRAIRKLDATLKVEVLVPDFRGNLASIDVVCQETPYVFNHNLELVPSIFKTFRPMGDFQQSLAILDYVKRTGEIPPGVEFIPAENRFSYTTTIGGNNGNEQSTEGGTGAE